MSYRGSQLMILALASLLVAPAPGATGEIHVEAVVHLPAPSASFWLSDLEVVAAGYATADYVIEYRDGTNTPSPVLGSVAPGTAVRLSDIVLSEFGLSTAAGGLRVTSNADLLVSGRTFNSSSSGTYGSPTLVRGFAAVLSTGDVGTLVQLSKNLDHRSNLQLLNTSFVPMTVTVTTYAADGSVLSATPELLAVNEFRQIINFFPADVDDGYATVSTATVDGSFIAAAQLLSDSSGDPATIPALAAASSAPMILPFAISGTGVGTDLELVAGPTSSGNVTVQLLLTGVDNSMPASHAFALVPGQAQRISDVLATEFSHSGTAALRIVPGTVQIFANGVERTGASAPFLRHIPAVQESDAFPPGSAALLMGLDDTTDFATDAGAVNATNANLNLSFALFKADGSYLGHVARFLPPYGHVVIDDVFTEVTPMPVSNGLIVVTTDTVGGAFIPFATVTDLNTTDSRFVEGQPYSGPLADHVIFADGFESGDTSRWSVSVP